MNIYSKNLNVVKRNKLDEILEKDIENSKEILTEEQINQIYNRLSKYMVKDEKMKEKHIQKIKEKYVI